MNVTVAVMRFTCILYLMVVHKERPVMTRGDRGVPARLVTRFLVVSHVIDCYVERTWPG